MAKLAGSLIQMRHRLHGAILSKAVEPVTRVGSEDDHSIGTPRTTASSARFTDRLRPCAGDADLLQQALSEETDELSIGREERIGGALRLAERRGAEAIEPAKPQKDVPFGIE